MALSNYTIFDSFEIDSHLLEFGKFQENFNTTYFLKWSCNDTPFVKVKIVKGYLDGFIKFYEFVDYANSVC